jgi:hypothetical protein
VTRTVPEPTGPHHPLRDPNYRAGRAPGGLPRPVVARPPTGAGRYCTRREQPVRQRAGVAGRRSEGAGQGRTATRPTLRIHVRQAGMSRATGKMPCAGRCSRSGVGRSRNDQPGRAVPSSLYREPRIANQRDCYRERRREYGQAIVVRNMLLVLVALAGAAGQLVTGTDRALSGVIAVRPRSSTLERVRAVLGRVKSPEGCSVLAGSQLSRTAATCQGAGA